jgi:hypothetical protein
VLARLVAAVGNHHQRPLLSEVPDQEGQQVAGGAVAPVQILDHQHQRVLLGQAPEQPEQQLEQSGLSGLLGRFGVIRLTQGGQKAG